MIHGDEFVCTGLLKMAVSVSCREMMAEKSAHCLAWGDEVTRKIELGGDDRVTQVTYHQWNALRIIGGLDVFTPLHAGG